MSDLNTTLVHDFERFYREGAQKIRALVEPLTDEQIWTRRILTATALATCCCILTGNLSYYIAGEIGGSGYVRNRPLEFTDTSHARKAVLLKIFEGTSEMVAEVIKKIRTAPAYCCTPTAGFSAAEPLAVVARAAKKL